MDTEIYQLIDQYLQNELQEDERQNFQQRLEKEPLLAEALNFRQASLRYLKTQIGLADLKKEMAPLSKQYFESEELGENKKKSLQPWLWPVAAAACIALALLLWNPFQQSDPYQRFAQHSPLNLTEKSRALDSIENEIASRAEKSFNAGHYEETYQYLRRYYEREYLDDDQIGVNDAQKLFRSPQVELAFGIAAMETERYEEAAVIFTRLAEGESVYQTAGQWYLALLFVKQKQYAEAKKALAQINPDSAYSEKAKKLLQALEKKE